MKFKGIDVYGFKSFADRASIQFQDGVTEIVGPNGCGKSNVVDAIRWVLGEQSAKLLRGKTMQDVIFSGTEKRKSLSYCEVALKFDNSPPDRIFKTLEFDEVIIGRKLFKNGNSEYSINGVASKLSTIKALIRETGLGREGYSIIGQKRVDEIVSAKPENRRAVFEDAAGVLGNKQAKREAENNLKQHQINRQQIELLLSEMEKNLSYLERQSENAKKAQLIYDELKILEANSYIFQRDNSGAQRDRILSKIQGLTDQIKQFTSDTDILNTKFTSLNIEQETIDAELTNLNDEYTKYAVNEENIKGQGNTLLATKEGLLRTREDYSRRLSELEDEFDKKNEKLRDLRARQSMLVEDQEDTLEEYNKVTLEQAKIVGEILEKEKQIENRNAEIEKLLGSIGDIKANLGKIKAQKQAAFERIADYQEELDKIQEKIDNNENIKSQLEAVVDKLEKDKNRLQETTAKMNQRNDFLKEQLDALRDRGEELKTEISSQMSRLSILEEIKKAHSGFNSSVKNLLQAADNDSSLKSRVQGVVADIMKVPEKFQVAIEVALGANIQNIVVNDEIDAKYLIEYLRQYKLGRVTFLPISSYKTRELDASLMGVLNEKGCLGVASKLIQYSPKFYTIFSGLLGSTIICDSYDNAIDISKKYGYSVKIVTIQGDVINTSGSISGGSQKPMVVNLLAQDGEITKLNESIDEQKIELKDVVTTYKEYKEEYDDLQDQLVEYEEETSQAVEKYSKENARLESIVDIIVDLIEDKDAAQKHLNNAKENYEAISLALAKVDKESQDVSGDKDNIGSEAKRSREEFNSKKEKKEKLDEIIVDLKVKLEGLKTSIGAIQTEIDNLEQEKVNINASIKTCKDILFNNESSIKNADSKLKKAIITDEDKKRANEILTAIKNHTDRKSKITQELLDINTKKDELTNQLVALNETKARQENTLSNLAEKMIALEARMKEDYELDYDGALKYKDPEFKYEEAQIRIKSLKASRNALGSVDFSSIERYEQEKENYDNYKKEYDDIIKAEKDCQDIIDNLTKEILEKFNSEFEKINANFQVIFKQLFGGGSGRLEIQKIEPGEDPLEAGIDILAQPPGKKVQHMSLLSGGEQSLTAIAILFAIVQLRPMPFVVLDEVDAALDDGNVGVYAKYLKSIAKTTQFIIITHRKLTMEIANKLFGVTMQEKGVSKIVQVSLDEAIGLKDKKVN